MTTDCTDNTDKKDRDIAWFFISVIRAISGQSFPMIQNATEILRVGGLVAIPTETVYGLGADATNAYAVRNIFAAKGRPNTNPLIVHVADQTVAKRYVRIWPENAAKLANQFWPGPLTIVLSKTDAIVREVSAGRDTVGIRVPNHPMALDLLRAFDGPIAAPSANRANHISPTCADDVRAELGDAVDLILDGGPCTVGIESTVIDLSGIEPRILRPGGVTREQIEALIGPVQLFQGSVEATTSAISPGQQARHYSPNTPAYRFDLQQREEMLRRVVGGERICLLLFGTTEARDETSGRVMVMPTEPSDYARELYRALRHADSLAVDALHVEMPPNDVKWTAVRDRLLRATRH